MNTSGSTAAPAFKKSVLREYLESVVVAVILALFIRAFVVQAFKIPTGSMETNLLIGDHLLVNKVIYSPSMGAFEDVLLGKKPIRRGDVIVFKFHPEDPSKDFIKRVIGLPGETVEVRDKRVYIDGVPLVESYLPKESAPLRQDDPEYSRGGGATDNWGPSVVPADELFVMGDNRDNSRDSRSWGFLRRDAVKGRALLVYWSYAATKEEYTRTGWLDWIKDSIAALGKTRWRRFFHIIH